MDLNPPLQHPDARCGRCQNCRHVASTRTIVISHAAPAGPGITQRETDLWNTALTENPCTQPLVLVRHNRHIVPGRVADGLTTPANMMVDTLEFGRISVPRTHVSRWAPAQALEGINFEHLKAALATMPSTWMPGLLRTILRAAKAKDVFQPGATAQIARQIEEEEAEPPGT